MLKNQEYVLYLDESTKIINKTNFFCVGGAIINRKEYENYFIPKMTEIKTKYWNDKNIVWHYNRMLRNDGVFDIFKDGKIRTDFWRDVHKFLSKGKFVSVGTYVNQDLFNDFFTSPNIAYYKCFYELMNIYAHFLESCNSKGSIILESRSGADNKAIWNIFNNIFKYGTIEYDQVKFNKYVTTLGFINKSENNCGLQIADIIPYKLLETLNEEQKDSYNLRKTIQEKLYKNKNKNDYMGFRNVF